jgi:hypothetical protein
LDSTAGEPAGKVEVSAVRSGQRGRAAKSCASVMKNLLLLILIGLVGYFLLSEGCAPPDKPVPTALPEAPKPTPEISKADPRVLTAGNDFFIYTRVKKMYLDWKERTVGTQKSQPAGARNEDLSVLLTEIRVRLGQRPYRLHKMESVEEVMLVSLARPDRDLNVPADQRRHVLAGILREAASDGRERGLNRSN